MRKEHIELILDKVHGISNSSWSELQKITDNTDVHPDTFRKGCWILEKVYREGLLDLGTSEVPVKKMNKGAYVSEVIKKFTEGEHFSEDDLLKLHSLKAGKFKIKSAKSSVWGNEDNMSISSSISYEPKNGVSFDEIVDMYTRLSPKNLRAYRPQKTGDRVIEMIPADLHFNKIAFDGDGEIIYNVDIASGIFLGYVEHMIAQAHINKANKCIFVWSNDFFNSESTGATTHGTPQRNDKTPEKAFELASELMITTIELLRSNFEYVDVVYVPSNHDKSISFNLACLLQKYFEKCENVSFDNSPTTYRKYRKFGINTNGYTHDIVSSERIRGAMQEEATDLMAGSKERIFHAGHKHSLEFKEHNGSAVMLHPSGCPPDDWHNEKVYLGHLKKFTATVYDLKDGVIAILFYKPRGVE